VARAFEAYELGAPNKFTQEQIFDSIKKEHQQRLQTNDIIKSDPKGGFPVLARSSSQLAASDA
jgi:hypothetical protein